MPSAARVRPATAAMHNSLSVRCAPLACANDLTPCRMPLHFDSASARATTPSKRPAPTATRGSSYTASLALRFLDSFQASIIKPIHPFQRGILDVFNLFPWLSMSDHFGFLKAIDHFCHFKAVNNRDRNFTENKIKRRREQIETSIDRYLSALETADLLVM